MSFETAMRGENYTHAEKSLHQSILAARHLTETGQYDEAATIMKAASDAYLKEKL